MTRLGNTRTKNAAMNSFTQLSAACGVKNSKYTGVLCMRCSTLQLPQATKRVPKNAAHAVRCGKVGLRTKRDIDLSNATSKGNSLVGTRSTN
jgi:ribosomal protein L40E